MEGLLPVGVQGHLLALGDEDGKDNPFDQAGHGEGVMIRQIKVFHVRRTHHQQHVSIDALQKRKTTKEKNEEKKSKFLTKSVREKQKKFH